MATQNAGRGRGRGRPPGNSSGPPPPSTEVLSGATPTTVDTTTSSTHVTDELFALTPAPTDASQPDTGFSSASSTLSSSTTSPPTLIPGRGRGRGTSLKPNKEPNAPSVTRHPITTTQQTTEAIAPPDPYWTVSNLTRFDFYSSTRPTKPDQVGIIGRHIEVIANYFPILGFPHRGLVHKYHIQMVNWKKDEIHRDHRRVLYNSWLNSYCRRYPQLDRHLVVFDNQMTILSFDQTLPGINEQGTTEKIMGPNRANRQVPYQVIVQQSGNPVDLAALRNLDQFYAASNASNERYQDLQNIQQVLSIALHEHCSSHAEFIYDRSFFPPVLDNQHGTWDLGMGKALWRGFYSCLVFSKGQHQLLMNLNVKHTVFLKKQPFLEFLCEVMLQCPSGKGKYGRERNMQKVDGADVLMWLDQRNRNYRVDMEFLAKQCKYMRVRSQDATKPIVYTIKKLANSASTQTFTLNKKDSDRPVTVQNYYQERYNVDLLHPSLPTLEMTNGSYLPMELVDVEPARVKKVTDDQRAAMCRISTIIPAEHKKAIERVRQNPKQQCFEEDPFVQAWNLNIDVRMITIPARVLPMPTIVYTDQYRVAPDHVRTPGVWEATTGSFFDSKSFPSVWGIINLSQLTQKECEEFYYELKGVAQHRGMTCPSPEIYEEYDVRHQSIEHCITLLRKVMDQNHDCGFLLVILPKDVVIGKQAYINLKKLCELETGFGIATQMLKETNAVKGSKRDKTRWDLSKLNNILLKINPKLNGTNSVLKVHDVIERFFSRGHRIMYVGVDLSHILVGPNSRTSAVAVVASADDVPNKYFKEVYKQERSGQLRGQSIEQIVDMKQIMKSLISQYEKYRGYPPIAIVIYRDGISEGEFDTVFEKELESVREACTELSPVYRPCLTYIVVNKRHHTRFYPTNPGSKNVEAGTVVDSDDITNPVTYNFYLNSQHGALGTSRPTHYHVLYDDNKLKPDEVQLLTYALCYTYARCTRSVSIPSPVKYADLLALRAGFYIQASDQSDTESVASGSRVVRIEGTDVKAVITSERVVLSSNLSPECPFFV